MKTTQVTVLFLRNVLAAMRLEGARNKLDIFTDRLIKATSEPTLALAMEHLLRSLNASADVLSPQLTTAMIRVSGSHESDQVLRWMREQARLITMLAASNDQTLVKEALEEIDLPDVGGTGAAVKRQPYQINIKAVCETPLTHGADGKAGNATLFRRIAVLATNGAVMELPYYSGNALRGQMRDLLADHFLLSLGLPISRSKPSVALWFFYCLYSGGALEEKSDAMKAIRTQLGDNGAIKADGIRTFREMVPMLSLLGCALGNRVLPGHLQVGDLRPVCAEWGTGDKPVAELLSWEFLTRREDYEDHIEHHGMIANTEVLRAGTELEGGIDHDTSKQPIENNVLGRGLELIQARGMLGAENRRGLGRVNMQIEGAPDGAPYDAWLAENKETILAYLTQIGALA